MEERKTPKRLVVDVTENLHQEVKLRALRLNIPLKIWLLQSIFEKIEQEKRFE